MSVTKTRAYLSEAPFTLHSSVRSLPYHKYETMLERLASGKQSSLLQKFINYGQKSFITFASGPNDIKLFCP